jgi:beta-galactosidase
VELFLNGRSLGVKRKVGDSLNVDWKVKFEPGTLKAISRRNGKIVLVKEIHTAGVPAKVILTADRSTIKADGKDLSYITVKIVDKDGNVVPDADNLVHFRLKGLGVIAGVDNGSQSSMEPFNADYRKAFHGMCLAIIQSEKMPGRMELEAIADGLTSAKIGLKSK